MKAFIQHTIFPILAAMIWGTAFSAQTVASEYVQPFAVNAFRGLVASAVLALVCVVLKIRPGERKQVIRGSLLCGMALFIASNFQQYGIGEAGAGKSGFITALYIVLVPVFGIFLNKRTTLKVWIAVFIAVVGMYFLCVKPGVTFGMGDLALLICAVMFTLQIFAQKGGNPSLVSLLLSLESVFALLGGMILLGEKMTGREYAGCALMGMAILISQLPDRQKEKEGA